MWDSWLFEWQGVFHLFFLETQEPDKGIGFKGDQVGHAVSDDLVHWTSKPSIPFKGQPGEWNNSPALTGMIITHMQKFYMFLGSTYNGVQVYGLFMSEDLDHWTPHKDNPIIKPEAPYYLSKPADFFQCVCWRDPYVTYRKEDGYYHAVLCARLPKWSDEQAGAAVGHIRSKDLINWEHLPPIVELGDRFYQVEIPEIFELYGKYYMTLVGGSVGGQRQDTPYREDTTGVYYMISSNFEGPYHFPEDSLLIGAGGGRRDAHVGRTIPYKDTRLLYHDVVSDVCTWSAPKLVRTRKDETLYLEYFPLLEKLETAVIYSGIKEVPPYKTRDLGVWRCRGHVLVGKARNMGTTYKLANEIADLHLNCIIQSTSAIRAGVVLRREMNKGIGIVLDFAKSEILISDASYYWATGWFCKKIDLCRHPLERNKDYKIRCFARDEHFEVYLDDKWIFTTAFPNAPKSGDVELLVEHGEAIFSDLRIATIEPLS